MIPRAGETGKDKSPVRLFWGRVRHKKQYVVMRLDGTWNDALREPAVVEASVRVAAKVGEGRVQLSLRGDRVFFSGSLPLGADFDMNDGVRKLVAARQGVEKELPGCAAP